MREGIDLSTLIRRRDIPVTADVLVSVGDAVLPSQPIARIEILPGRLWRVDIAEALSIPPAEVPSCLIKTRGERVAKNEVIAVGGMFFSRQTARSPATGVLAIVSRNRGVVYVREDVELGSQEGAVEVPVTDILKVPPWTIMIYKNQDISVGVSVVKGQILASKTGLGLKTVSVEAPIYGRVSAVSAAKGTITLSPLFKSQSVFAWMKGTVSRIVPGESVEIAGRAWAVSGIWGMGGEGYGRLHFVDGDLVKDQDIPQGAVVVVKGTASLEALKSAADSGASGVILRYLHSSHVMKFAGGIKSMGVTGDEDVPFPLILLEGFAPGLSPHPAYDLFCECEGLLCSVSGATHIRAGVIRPQILVFPDDERSDG